jgi:hypothetical protein
MKTCALAAFFWLAAAVIVAAMNLASATGVVAAVAAIIAAAYGYTRFCARNGGIDRALGVGIAWLVMAIAVELSIGRGWYGLLGSPARPLLRNVFLFVWIFAPACFARRADKPR